MSAAQLTEATRAAVTLLVKIQERQVGRRDIAVENVASLIGSSASWVQKFIGASGEVKEPRLTLFLNIRAAYENLCNRVEQERQAELANIALLKKEIDAATGGFVELVQGNARAQAGRNRARRDS